MKNILLFLLLSPLAFGTTYFVKNGGSDAAAGTSDGAAWATIAKVNGFTFSSGDVIQFKRGSTWNEATDAALTVPASNLTFTVYDSGAQPILDGMGSVAQGITVSSKASVVIDNLNLKRNTSYNVLFASCSTCSITNSTLSDAGVHSVNVTGATPTFTATGNTYSTSAAFHMTGKAFNIASTSASVSTISSNTIDLSQVLSTDSVSAIVCSASTTGCVAANNTITMAQGVQGIGIKSASASGSVTGGQITGNSITGLTSSCTGCDGEGIELTGDVTNQVTGTLIRGNFIKLGSAAADCIGLFHAVSNVVSYNFCIGNSGTNAGIHPASNSDTNLFYGNSLYLPSATYGFEVTGTSINNDIQNNIVVGSGYGIIFSSGGTGTFSYNDAFSNATANFSGGTNSGNNLTSDPLWTSSTPTSANDFKLQATSPAINAGHNLGSTYQLGNAQYGAAFPYASANQNSFGTTWGKGAFVFTGTYTQREVGSGQIYSTVQAGINAAVAGDIVNVHAGTYSECLTLASAGSVGNVKTLRANPGDTVTVSCSASTTLLLLKSYWTISGINFTYSGSGSAPVVLSNVAGNNLDGVTISNNFLTVAGGSSSGFCANIADSDLLSITGNTCFISASTGTHDGWDLLTASHLTFSGNITYGNASEATGRLEDGLVTSGTNLTIGPNNVFHDGWSYDNHPDAIVIQGDGDRNGNPTNGVVISRNTLWNFSQLIYIDAIHNPIGAVTPTRVENNILYESGYLYGGANNKVNCAVFDGENVGGTAAYLLKIEFNNNVLDCGQLHIYGSRLFTGSVINIKNNVFLNLKFTGLYFPAAPGVTLDYNYYSAADATPFNWNGTNRSLASFKTFASPQEANSTVGTANLLPDYSEQLSSDTINRGANLTAIFTNDLVGHIRPATGPWDSGAYQIVTGTPVASISPSSLAFTPPSQVVSTSSTPKDLTVTNTGTANLSISGITITGTNANQFSQTNTCGAVLNFGLTCTISVTFSPTSAGAKTAAISIASDASGSPHTAALTGTAIAVVPIVISPSAPVLRASATQTFTASQSGNPGLSVTWSCPGCAGSVNSSTGVYTAPSNIPTGDSVGGCQTSPNGSIWNTRADTMPLDSNSATIMSTTGAGNLKFAFPREYGNSFGNFDDGTFPSRVMSFAYTPQDNGVSYKIPPLPNVQAQRGWYATTGDRHIMTTILSTCEFQELYGLHAPTATPNAQSGTKYNGDTYALPSVQSGGSSTSAAGTPLVPLELHLQEMEKALATGGTIKHAIRLTLKYPNNLGKTFIWPARTNAHGFGQTKYGTRFRLKSSYTFPAFSASCPVGPCRTIVNILITQLKQYGVIVTDGGTPWEVVTSFDAWPSIYQTAFAEIFSKNINPLTNVEVADESGYVVSNASSETTTGERVVATETAVPSNTASVPVVMRGVTINASKDIMNIQAGMTAYQLPAPYIGGTANTGVTYTMSPTVGTLTTGGLYTPPATTATVATTLVTLTSAADSTATSYMTINVLPVAGGITRIITGRAANYTDSNGDVWQNGAGMSNGSYIVDHTNTSSSSPPGLGWATTANPDIFMYKMTAGPLTIADFRYDFVVPNGFYNITARMASWRGSTGTPTLGLRKWDLETQGNVIYPDWDLSAAAGGDYIPVDVVLPATVTNNTLSFVMRPKNNIDPFIQGLIISPASGPPPPPNDQAASISPASLTFTGLTVGVVSAAQTITVTNTGTTGSLHISGAPALSGTSAAQFAIASTTCTGATLAPAATCTIDVTLTPVSNAGQSAVLTLTDDDNNVPGSTQRVNLSGLWPTGVLTIQGVSRIGVIVQ